MAEKSNGRKSLTRQYGVEGVAIDTKREVNEAMAEFAILQDKALEANYMTWAKYPVEYDRLEDDNAAMNLKQANDAYTLSMLMNCISPLREGIKPSSLMQVWMSYKLITSINPSLEGDISRLCSNLRDDVGSISKNIHGPAKILVKPLAGSLDGFLANTSARKIGDSVQSHMESNTVDDMVMTPKQLAALKVGFMEQYYYDMRVSGRDPELLQQNYEAAMGHVQVIAKNSGFDMSVVAAEERHLVGLKIRANPAYQNMFVETADVYGARPAMEDGMWSDRFLTGDGHEYLAGEDVEMGAFTPRPPVKQRDVFVGGRDSSDMKSGKMAMNLMDRGQRFAYMELWLDSDDCTLDSKMRAKVKKDLDGYVSEYREMVERQLIDDGVYREGNAKKAVAEFWEATFDAAREDALNKKRDDVEYKGFQVELHRIVDKEVMSKAGIQVGEDTFANIENGRDCPELQPLTDYARSRAARYGGTLDPGASGVELARRMRYNYIDGMTRDELARLMLHTGTNQQQGLNNPNVDGANPGRGTRIESLSDTPLTPEEEAVILNEVGEQTPQEMSGSGSTKETKPDDEKPSGQGNRSAGKCNGKRSATDRSRSRTNNSGRKDGREQDHSSERGKDGQSGQRKNYNRRCSYKGNHQNDGSSENRFGRESRNGNRRYYGGNGGKGYNKNYPERGSEFDFNKGTEDNGPDYPGGR